MSVRRVRLNGENRKSKKAIDLMMDSGAFSAWNRGKSIELKEYISYLKDLGELFHSYVVLDVLPSGPEQTRTEKDIEACAAKSYKNQQIMKDAGLRPMPVFHQGERWHWLEKMLEEGEPFIGLSTRKDLLVYETLQMRWLDDCFSVICDSKGAPYTKVHGFGTTKVPYLQRYPFYSVDSTRWALASGYGKIMVPNYDKKTGSFDYSRPPTEIHITDGEKVVKHGTKILRYDYLGEPFKEIIVKYLEEEVGVNLTEAKYLVDARRMAVLTYYERMAATFTNKIFEHIKTGSTFKNDGTYKAAPVDRLNIMYATGTGNTFARVLKKAKVRNQLLSYFITRDMKDKDLETYVMTGLFREGKKMKARQAGNWNSEAYLNRRRSGLLKKIGKYEDEYGQEETFR